MSTVPEPSRSEADEVAAWDTLYALQLHPCSLVYLRRSEIARIYVESTSPTGLKVCFDAPGVGTIVLGLAHDVPAQKMCALLVAFVTQGKTRDKDNTQFAWPAHPGARSMVEVRMANE